MTIGKVYLIEEYKLDLVNMHILNEVMDGLKIDLIDFEIQSPISGRKKNSWEILSGSLRYYIEKGFKKWLKET